MPIAIFTTQRTPDGEVMVSAKREEIFAAAGKYKRAAIIVTSISDTLRITAHQTAWFKGILLPGLANQTGDSMGYWEDLLKLFVMPDQFAPVITKTNNGEFEHLPSITILSKTEMNEMINGSVAHLRDESIYGNKFLWVTLPAKELRS